jgi:hypothetical protein
VALVAVTLLRAMRAFRTITPLPKQMPNLLPYECRAAGIGVDAVVGDARIGDRRRREAAEPEPPAAVNRKPAEVDETLALTWLWSTLLSLRTSGPLASIPPEGLAIAGDVGVDAIPAHDAVLNRDRAVAPDTARGG